MLSRNIFFFLGQGGDSNGALLRSYLDMSPKDFESRHDFIQWAFPTDQISAFNPQSEPLTKHDALVIRNNFASQVNLALLWSWARAMYSFKIPLVGTHNELRASRIVRSLSILSHDDCDLGLESYEFFSGRYFLEVKEKTNDFWYKNRIEGADLWRQ